MAQTNPTGDIAHGIKRTTVLHRRALLAINPLINLLLLGRWNVKQAFKVKQCKLHQLLLQFLGQILAIFATWNSHLGINFSSIWILDAQVTASNLMKLGRCQQIRALPTEVFMSSLKILMSPMETEPHFGSTQSQLSLFSNCLIFQQFLMKLLASTIEAWKMRLDQDNSLLLGRCVRASSRCINCEIVFARSFNCSACFSFVLVFKLLSPAPISEFSPLMTNGIAQLKCACTFDRVVIHFYVIFEHVQQHPCPETDNNTTCIKYSLISNWSFGQAFGWEIDFHFYYCLV